MSEFRWKEGRREVDKGRGDQIYGDKRKLEDGCNLSTNLLLVSKWEAEFIDWEKIKGEKQI